MHRIGLAVMTAALLALGGTAQALNKEDQRYVRQCVADSAGMNASQETKVAYCTCMVNKMDDNETRSVSQWEQANPRAAAECARMSGWR